MKTSIERSQKSEITKHMKIIILLIVIVGSGLFSYILISELQQPYSGESRSGWVLESNHTEIHLNRHGRGHSVVSLDVNISSKCDVYLFLTPESEEPRKYNNGKNFEPYKCWENVTKVDKKWTTHNNKDFILIIDNSDNIHPEDAIPNGTVYYDYDMELYARMNEVCCSWLSISIICTIPVTVYYIRN